MESSSSSPSLKQEKEAFVTGLQGTSAAELLLICSTTVIGTFFYVSCSAAVLFVKAQQQQQQQQQHKSKLSDWTVAVIILVVELLSFPLPMILCQTVYLYPFGVGYLGCQVLLGLIFSLASVRRQKTSSALSASTTKQQQVQQVLRIRRSSITIYRSSLLCLTVIAILAVDFHVFPRRFGKTETTGYSLMDLGAASFVIAAGIVSPRARGTKDAVAVATVVNWKRTLPVVALGILRWVTHKELEYQEHVSEYGVHWNFFWTLALLTPVAALLSQTGAPAQQQQQPGWVRPVAVLGLYQSCLSFWGLQDWVEEAPRSCSRSLDQQPAAWICDMFAANREGILGCISYAALYLVSECVAYRYFWSQHHDPALASLLLENCGGKTSSTSLARRTPIQIVASATFRLWLAVATLLAVWQGLLAVGIEVSRRTTNLSFCVWVLFVNLFQLTCVYSVVLWHYCCCCCRQSCRSSDEYCEHDENDAVVLHRHLPPTCLDVVNRHGMISFVIANLLTGAVNLSINTLIVSDGPAMVLLGIYTCAVGGVALAFDRLRERRPKPCEAKRD